MTRASGRLLPPLPGTAAVPLAAVLAAFPLAYLATRFGTLSQLVLGGLGLLGVLAVSPAGVAVLAVPGIWLAGQRVAGLLSVGDALLVVAALTAMAAGFTRALPLALRSLSAALAVLLAADLVSVIVNGSAVAAQEVFHRVVIVLFAAVVGAWLQELGWWPKAARALIAVTGVFAAVACFDALVQGPPAYPLGYHKNFAGGVFAVVVILLLVTPTSCGLREGSRLRWALIALLLGGLLGTASRGAMLGLALAVLVFVLRPARGGRRVPPVVAVALVLVLGYVGASSVQQQLTDQARTGDQDSLTQRADVEQATRDLWRTEPATGVGLRYFTTPEYAGYQAPNNMFDEALAEAGVLGAAALAFFVLGSLIITWRLRHPLGLAANMILVNAFFHGQVDIFWANGQALNWLIVGAAAACASGGEPRGPGAIQARGQAIAEV